MHSARSMPENFNHTHFCYANLVYLLYHNKKGADSISSQEIMGVKGLWGIMFNVAIARVINCYDEMIFTVNL